MCNVTLSRFTISIILFTLNILFQDKSQVTSIPGPGKMLLCMDIVKNRVSGR
jgi:hypothetical protein